VSDIPTERGPSALAASGCHALASCKHSNGNAHKTARTLSKETNCGPSIAVKTENMQ
jgi:hypothetical protein